MRFIIEIIITFAVLFGLLKLGWPWPILAIPAYLLAFALKLPFLSRRTKVTSRFLVVLLVFLAVAASLSWLVAEALFQPEVQDGMIAKSWLLSFLWSNNTLKLLWSVIIGLLIPALLAMIALIPYGYTVGQNMYSQYENYKGHEQEASFSAISVLLGIGRGSLIVSNGQVETRGESGGALTRFGGPGTLIVQEGHAVILEKSGKLSRVVGRGITWLEPFERISMVVPLFTRTEKMTIEQVATKDKIMIDEFEILVFHKVDPGPEEDRIEDGQFMYNEDNIRKNIWNPGGSDWRNGVRSVAETATRDLVGQYDLQEITPLSDTVRAELRKKLADKMNEVTKPLMGVIVASVDINRIKIPSETQKRLSDKWMADWDILIAGSERQATILRGEASAVLLKVKEVAWAEAQREIIEKVTGAFRDVGVTGTGQVGYVVALRTLETLEKMAADPATKVLLPNEILTQLTDVHQWMLASTSRGDGEGNIDAKNS